MINVKDVAYIKLFGNNLRELRLLNNLSQEDLAFTADISISQISRIERGKINPTISTIKTIATALNIEMKELFDFDNN